MERSCHPPDHRTAGTPSGAAHYGTNGRPQVGRGGDAITTRRTVMISRLWHGWTRPGDDADRYEELLRNTILPGIRRVPGYRGAYLMRRDDSGETEFVTLTLFDSMEAVRAFAGEDYARAVIHREARPLLTRFDERSAHYSVSRSGSGRNPRTRGRGSRRLPRDGGRRAAAPRGRKR